MNTVIPCYNRETTIAAAIESVALQDYPAFDICVVDDRSVDQSAAVVRGLDLPNVTLEESTRTKGPSGARNHGAFIGTAPWIAFQDSDDLWLQGRLSRQMEQLASSDFVAGYCGMVVKSDASGEAAELRRIPDRALAPLSGDILETLCRTSFVSTQMLIVRRDIFEALGGFDETIPALEDWDLMLRVAQLGPVAFLDADLVVQRLSDNSITHVADSWVQGQEAVLKRHDALFRRRPKARAFHHHRLAGAHHRIGNCGAALRHEISAAVAAPLNPLYMASIPYRIFPSSGRRVR